MSALGWTSLVRLVRRLGTRARTTRAGTPKARKAALSLESLESISLLSTVGATIRGTAAALLHDARHHRHTSPVAGGQGSQDVDMAAAPTIVTLPPVRSSLGDTLTNFTNVPLSPSLNLFDPSLGTLVSVTLIQSSSLQSTITSQNLSPTSTTTITANLSGSFQIDGLNQPIVQPTQTITSQPVAAGVFGSNNDTATFPPLQITNNSSATFTDAANLAFFTASPGRTTITPTMTATGTASASAPNGNLLTITRTSASVADLAVSYTYLPFTPPPIALPCPTVGAVGRVGLHHQKTLLILPFNGVVDPVAAGMPRHYVVLHYGQKTPIVWAHYNPDTNTVTLQPRHRLNVHHRFRLKVTLPCPDGMTDHVVYVPFGRKDSLIGFHNKHGHFIPVHNGHVARTDPPARQESRPGPHSKRG